MSVSRRIARAGLAVFALSAGALAVAVVSDQEMVSRWVAGKPDARSHGAASHKPSQTADSSQSTPAAPPTPLEVADASDSSAQGGVQTGPSDSIGALVAIASTEGFTPGTTLALAAVADEGEEAGVATADGQETGTQGLRTQARSLTFAAVSSQRLDGAGAYDMALPDEPTSAGVAVAAAAGPAWHGNGTGGVFGNAAVGSFATGAVIDGRIAQVPTRSASVPALPVVLASAVPEPESAAMLLAGLVALGVAARRRVTVDPTAKT